MKKIIKIILYFFILLTMLNLFIEFYYRKFIYEEPGGLPQVYVGLVPGASVRDNRPSWILKQRLNEAIRLYVQKKIRKILLSGDNLKKRYRETDVMKNYLLRHGIKAEDIFMDHYGTNTMASLFNAKQTFSVKEMIIISQKFHLSRALFISRQLGMRAYGWKSNGFVKKSNQMYYLGREFLARYVAIRDIFFASKREASSKEKFNLKGNGTLSWRPVKIH